MARCGPEQAHMVSWAIQCDGRNGGIEMMGARPRLMEAGRHRLGGLEGGPLSTITDGGGRGVASVLAMWNWKRTPRLWEGTCHLWVQCRVGGDRVESLESRH